MARPPQTLRGDVLPSGLDGAWDVERTSGLLPPMVGVRKHITGGTGETRLGPVRLPFRVESDRGGGARLAYGPPVPRLVDRIRPEGPDEWSGTATLAGLPIGRFRMRRVPGTRLP